MDQADEKKILDVFSSIKPYLTYASDTKEKIQGMADESSDLGEFKNNLNDLILEEEEPSKKADFRIFRNKLQSR